MIKNTYAMENQKIKFVIKMVNILTKTLNVIVKYMPKIKDYVFLQKIIIKIL